jgi:hypothetical protein
MSGEIEEDYTWALKRLKSLYSAVSYPAIDRESAELNAIRNVFPES